MRISNVDAQASFDNIVIQVIGETSNKSEEPRKFVQTFVLAQQPSGYFVLNDILRFIKEEEEDTAEAVAPAEVAELEATAAEIETEEELVLEATEATVPEPEPEVDAVVDQKLEEASTDVKDSSAASAVATPTETVADAAAANPTEIVAAPAQVPDTKVVEETVEEETKTDEAPKEPSPAPTATTAPVAAAAPAEPEKPKGPPKPMTWASRAAAAAGTARPAVAMPKIGAPVASTIKPAAPVAAPVVAAPAPSATKPASESQVGATATPVAAAALKEIGNEWQTAGSDSKRQNRPQSISGAVQDKDTTLGYVKYVTEKVDEPTLRTHLEAFGPVVYFDINRLKVSLIFPRHRNHEVRANTTL